MVSSNPCVGTLPRIKISLSLLSIYTDELASAPKIMKFFPNLPSANKNSEQESNPMLQPLNLHLSTSVFFVSFTDPNKQLFNVKFVDLVCKKYIDLLLL